jgi:hypothetical protein
MTGRTDAANWLSYGRTYSEQRFSPLSKINADNAKRFATDRKVSDRILTVIGIEVRALLGRLILKYIKSRTRLAKSTDQSEHGHNGNDK